MAARALLLALFLLAGCGDAPCVSNNAGHAECAARLGDTFYCGVQGDCLEVVQCLAISCCTPSEQGDRFCKINFGEASICEEGMCTR